MTLLLAAFDVSLLNYDDKKIALKKKKIIFKNSKIQSFQGNLINNYRYDYI